MAFKIGVLLSLVLVGITGENWAIELFNILIPFPLLILAGGFLLVKIAMILRDKH